MTPHRAAAGLRRIGVLDIIPPDGSAYHKLTPITSGQIVKLEVRRGDCVAHYHIDDSPMATPLKVNVDVGPAVRQHAPGSVVAGQIAGPMVFTLTGSAASMDCIDFAPTTYVSR